RGLTLQGPAVASDPDRVDPGNDPRGELLRVPRVQPGHGREVDGAAVAAGALWVVPGVQPETVALGAFDDHGLVAHVERLGAGEDHTTDLGDDLGQTSVISDPGGCAHAPVGPGRADTLAGAAHPGLHPGLGLAVLLGQDGGFRADVQPTPQVVALG